MYIDYGKINVSNNNLEISQERLSELKQIAKSERTFLINKYKVNNMTTILAQKAFEIAYVNSRNNYLSDTEKIIVANNIVFEDSKFAEIINKCNLDANNLEVFIKLIKYLKYKYDNNKLVSNDERYLETADNYAKKLVSHFNKYIGFVDSYVIINKLNELLTFNRELLEQKEKKHIR